jgi:hypothetical protein
MAAVIDIPIVGDEVTSICFEYGIVLRTLSKFEIRLSTTVLLEPTDRSNATIDPEVISPESLVILSALHQKVVRCTVREIGTMSMEFDGGFALHVPPNSDYEAWTVAGPGGYKVICAPGGEVVTWPTVG